MSTFEGDLAKFRAALASSLTTAEAAELCGLIPSSFRAAMSRERKRGNDYRTARTPAVLWSEAMLRGWLASRPGRGNWRKPLGDGLNK